MQDEAKHENTKGHSTTQIPATIPPSVRTPANRAAAASVTHVPKTSSAGKKSKDRSKRAATDDDDELLESVLLELNSKEFDDSEDIYDENSEENSDFYNLIDQIEKKQKDIFDV
ncbi:hypothetical protein GCK72_021143 [Caenorhabditis remanei]|uniref:Uncharacterized protein n=1 Tax=Caenorhabditis remanei TaxID=31234 RepID=A0A6A5GHB9_CAERE|nr:hypothetical protein GCK72_021143 [Caenorhabditis remanei]KAF1754580.1 hypothetical protein GCK72_021143 [Caenorhabditis remanei]